MSGAVNTNYEPLTVSGLNLYVKLLLESDRHLQTVYLRGEISNLTDHYRSGHIYLTLKDEHAAVKAVMFAGNARRLKFRPEDGMRVLVRGRVSLYEVSGTYQFYIEDMMPEGAGALNLAFEQCRKKLEAEGLFDAAHKKPLPPYPKRIGVITSPTGAALQDILLILKRRYPVGEIVFCPVLVQGDNAVPELCAAVRQFDRLRCADVMIIGRGGGSLEELWAFNDERLARAIYDCEIPVISAVGHETDFTICDFVSDVRASTPSAGAELASPETSLMCETLAAYHRKLKELMEHRLHRERMRCEQAARSAVLRSPMSLITQRQMKLDWLSGRMKSSYEASLSRHRHRFARLSGKLDTLSPLKVLARGYAIAEKDGRILRSIRDVSPQENITVRVTDGTIHCIVTDSKE